ncbi:hypothetical protein DOC35_19500 [Salmonella enterica subsp. enterica]|nr:hypothetical protein [Salmonella enterica subsp. enterica]
MNEKILAAKVQQLAADINARKIRESGGKGWNPKQRNKAAAFIHSLIYAVRDSGRIAATIGELESAAKMSGAHDVAMHVISELNAMKFIEFKDTPNGQDRFLYKGFMYGGGMYITGKFSGYLCPQPRRARRD